ncbi:T9SS type B sorting domain-containing protein [uncultured Kordia sp.]|uniref:T9SS type B sorting domain-containing protein n=1 Tax=uncultured Kordia sp. TaxID=507699 RepID=UPI0026173148|nr:T9SS type B sorting domain-containing protein [uncultured Kordia sp.]
MKKILLFILITLPTFLLAQGEAANWYFGQNAGLQFDPDTGAVAAVTDGSLNTLEGCASISDTDGNLLFYSDGITVWNRNHLIMTNGTGLNGDSSSTSSAIIVPKPQDPNIYYIFTVDEPHHDETEATNHGLNYTVVDMTDGIGFVDNAQKNIPLVTYDVNDAQERKYKCSEKISAVKSSDCESFWVLTHFIDDFYAFKVDNSGVDTTPVISSTPTEIPVSGYRRNALGYLKASPQGDKLAASHLGLTNVEGGNGPGKVMLYDFNNTTGIVSNELELYDGDSPYGVEFSPEGTKLYATVGLGNSGTGNSLLLQYDLLAADIPGSQFTINNSSTFSAGAIQVGIDGRIYRALLDFSNAANTGRFLAVIENPEANGAAVVYNENGVLLDITNTNTNLSRIGLPPFIQSLFATPVDIIRNGVSMTELSLCTTQSYTLMADDIAGATYTWTLNGNPLAETTFQLDLTNVTLADAGLYEVQIEQNNGECPLMGEANVAIFTLPTANPIEDQFICDDNNDGLSTLDLDSFTATVLNGQDTMLFTVTYHASQDDADMNMNPLASSYTNATAYGLDTIFVRIENNDNTTCFDTTSFDFDVFDQPTANAVMNYELCDDTADGDDTNGLATFDLSTLDTEVLAGQDNMQFNISYYANQTDANDAMNVLSTTYINTTAGGNAIVARIENVDNPNCFDTVTFNVVVHPLPVIMQPVALLQCDDDTDGLSDFNLTEANTLLSADAANETFTYYTSLTNAQNATSPIINDTAYNSSNGGQVFVRIETVNGCFRTGEVNLIVGTTQIPDTFQLTYEVCDDDTVDGDNTNGVATFDFSDADAQINALFTATGQTLTITYYENFADALAEQNAIADISNHRNDASPNVQNIVVRVDSDANNACLGLGEHITLTVNPLPDLNPVTDYVVCSDIANQFTFDLTIKDPEVINGQTNIDVTYHESQADADTNTGAIVSPFTTFPRTIYVRSTNTITGCVNTAMNFDLIINENPIANMPATLNVCDETPFDGFTAVDLNAQSAAISGTQTDISVQYYISQTDADTNTNPLAVPFTNTSNPQTIYVRVEHGITGCFSTTSFDIIVSEAPVANAPTPLEYCDTDNDGIGIFDLTNAESEITGGVLPGQVTVTYHETPEDADNDVNEIPNETAYGNINPYNQTIYVRVENVLTGCFNVVSLDLIVHDSPEIAALDATSLAECDDVTADQIAQFDLTEAEMDILNGEDPTTHTVRYYNTQANAVVGTTVGEINNPNAYSNIPPSPQVIWVRVEDQVTGCFSITNLTLIVNELPVLIQLPGLELCDAITLDDQIEVFDLTSLAEDLVNNVPGISLLYYANATDLANGNEITNPSMYPNAVVAVQTIFVLATNDTTGCQNTITFDIRVNPLPSPTLDPNGLLLADTCDDDNDGFVATDLDALVTAIVNMEPDVVYSFHETEAEAIANLNALASPYTNIVMDSQTLYVLATNTVTGCFTVTPLQINVIAIPEVPINITDLEVCDEDPSDGFAMFDLTQTQMEIYGTQTPGNLTLTYHESEQDAIDDVSPIVNLTDYINIIINQQTIWVRLEDNATECYAIGSFDIIVVDAPKLVQPTPFSLCDDLESGSESDEISSFDLTDRYLEIVDGDNGLTLTYYASEADLNADTPIADPTAYQNISNPQVLYIRAANAAGCTTDITMTLRVLPIPTPNTMPTILEACDDDTDGDATNGILIFDLTQSEAEIVNNESNVTVSYHTTQEDADADTNPIADPTMHAVDMATADVNGQVIIYVRVESDIQIDSNMLPCYKVVELPVIVHPLPELTATAFTYVFCEYDNDNVGQFEWDVVTASLDLLTAPQMVADFTVTYHLTVAEALAGTGALVNGFENMSDPQTIFIRVENTATGCVNTNNIASLELSVEPIPTATAPDTYQLCAVDEADQDTAVFDLTTLDADIINGQLNMAVSYYETATDADADINAIANATSYTNTSNPQTLYARVRQTITGCLSDPVLVNLQVNPLPVFTLPADDILCVDAATGTTQDGPFIGEDQGAGFTYLWNTPNGIFNTATVQVTTAGTYSLVITDGNFPTNCSYSDSVTYEASSAPASLDVQITTPAFADTHNVIATATGGSGVYEYQLDDGEWQDTGEFLDLQPGEHTVTVRDTNGCGELVRTFELIDYMKFFTPNGDEYHPTWNIIGLRNQPSAKIYIFDRYGKLLKQISPAGIGWDGTFNGSPMPSQDYWFRVEYVDPFDGSPKEFINHFTLKR